MIVLRIRTNGELILTPSHPQGSGIILGKAAERTKEPKDGTKCFKTMNSQNGVAVAFMSSWKLYLPESGSISIPS